MTPHEEMVAAIVGLRPGAQWALRGDTYEGLEWSDPVQTKPTEAEIDGYVPPPPAPAPDTAVLYEHENRILALEGQPPLSVADFIAKQTEPAKAQAPPAKKRR